MSYNTRRSGGNANYNNGMGGRGRPGIQHNFVSSGQQYQQTQKPGGVVPNVRPQAQQQTRPQQQAPPAQVRPQQQPAQVRPQPPAQSTPRPQQPTAQQFQPVRQPNAAVPAPMAKATPVPMPLKSAMKKEVKTEVVVAQTPPQQTVQPPPQPPAQPMVQSPVQPPAVKNAVAPVVQPTVQAPAVPPTLTTEKVEAMETENGEVKKKTLILKGKISKKEKRGRRNRRLRKILVPKNALMVLNELVGGHKFNFLDKDPSQPTFYTEPDTYIAAVTIEGTEHLGYGKSKTAAKTAAAETALRHIILSKISSPLGAAHSTQSVDSEGVQPPETMEVDGDKQEEEDVSWLHVASFAMHKLFSSWYAEGDDKLEQAKLLARTGVADMAAKLQDIKPFAGPPKTRKPAKQLPANPQLLNPVMLLNQMRDDITYEEYAKNGTAPHILFVIKTTVEGQVFYGKGGNKKVARKNCAYAACNKLYGITYPPEEFDPSNASVGVPLF